MNRDERLSATGRPDNLDPPRRDNEEWHDVRARLDEHFSRSDRTHLSMRSDSFNLSRRQRRKYTLVTRGKRHRNRKSCISHGLCTYFCHRISLP